MNHIISLTAGQVEGPSDAGRRMIVARPGTVAPPEVQPPAAWPAPPDFASMQPRRTADKGHPVDRQPCFLVRHTLPVQPRPPRPAASHAAAGGGESAIMARLWL